MCPRMSLATKTTVLIAATFFTVLVGTSLFLLHYQAESLKGSILQGLDGQAKIAAHGIEAFLDEGLTESNAASATFPEEALVAGRVGEVESHLRKMSATFPKFQNGIFVLDREGRLLVDYPPHPELRGQSFAFREYYQRTIQEGKGIVGKPYRSKRTGAPVLTFTAPVRDGKGQIIAIVACSMDLRSHEALGGYRKQKIGETGYLYVFDKSRLLVLHPDDEREMTYVEVGKNRVLEAALQGFEGAGESVNSAGVPMLLAVRRIPHSEWMVGVQITQKESYEPIGVARTRIFSLSSTAIVLAAILGGVAIRRVSRPLQQLERVASQISTDLEAAETQGTYNPSSSTLDSLRRICSGDEVGLLASAFSHLATRLNLTLDSMRRSAEALRLQATALESTANAIVITDRQGSIQWVNPAFTVLTGYTAEEALGQEPSFLKSGAHDAHFYQTLWNTILSGAVWRGEITNRRKDGTPYVEEMTITPVRSDKGEITQFIAIKVDITDRKTAEEQVKFLAYYDALTGLPNRTLFRDRLSKALASARRRKEKVALLFLDLDRFKTINDSLGHSVGDLLLKEVAERLKKWAREQDTVARLGGDEFVVVLTALMDIGDAAVAADRILKAMTPDCIVQGHLLSISCSLGISVFPDNGREPETLLKNADAAMYCAKEQGRNNFQFFTQEMNVQAVERMTLENSLRVALERNELFLVYQPQMDIATGQITGAEALLRWQHPVLGLVPPDKFIPIAENSGLIIPIGEWVLKTACVQARQWQDEGLPAIPVAVNVSAIQLRHNRFLQVVEKVLDEAGLRSQYLELELTEGLLFSNADLTLSLLQELSEMGLKLSIDDFGTGYSSLSYLRHFPVCKLKIDRSFVQAMTVNSDDAAITSTIINMGKSLNLTVIAEGVENEEQMSFLRDHGCDEIQGYYFSRPLAVADFPDKVRSTLSALVAQDLDPFHEDFRG
jgi:diguanylate cyclase (GGDEF)-like protein/PAS domain S-box-containing protein